MGRRGLGRGLSALIATGESVGGLKFEEIPTTAIQPNAHQPRRHFSKAGIQELAASIKEVGILQPLVIRPTDFGFELIAGERRLRAAKEAGLERVPVLIRQAAENESMELALVENLQREDLSPLETAAAYQALMDGFGLTREQLASRLGKSRAAVTNTLRLVQLPPEVQELLQEGKLTEGHARALLGLKTPDQILEVARKVCAEKLSVRRTEEIVREHLTTSGTQEPGTAPVAPPDEPHDDFQQASRLIQKALSLPVKVRPFRKGGKLEIRFRETAELEALIQRLVSPEEPPQQ